MAYGVIISVPAPIEAYHESHAEVEKEMDGRPADGLLLHMARVTGGGFEMIEVWESKDQCDRFTRDVVTPAMARTSHARSGPPPQVEEFEPLGLMLADR